MYPVKLIQDTLFSIIHFATDWVFLHTKESVNWWYILENVLTETLWNSPCAEAVSRSEVFCKKGVLRDFAKSAGERLCHRVSFLVQLQASACSFIRKETLPQVFSCEFYKISKNTFRYRTPPVAASVCGKTDVHVA